MAHLRQQIREAIGNRLIGLPTTGASVFQSRVYPVEGTDLPCLIVHAESETVQPLTMGEPRVVERLLTIHVDAYAKVVANLDDVLDGICFEVETALAMPSPYLDGIATEIHLTATEIELTGTSDQPTGRAGMTFEVNYFAHENAPDTAL
jgi:hypothetical protein